jgi:hypothetical protein
MRRRPAWRLGPWPARRVRGKQLRVGVAAGGQVQPRPPRQPRPLRCCSGRGGALLVAAGGAQGADDPLHVRLARTEFGGQVGQVDPPAALDLPLLVSVLDALAHRRLPGLQRDQGAGDVVAAGAKLAGECGGVEWLPGGLLAPVGQLDAVGERIRAHRPGRLLLGEGAAGAEPLGEGGELIGVDLAVVLGAGAQAGQPRVLLVDAAEGVQPLAGHRGRGAQLAGDRGGVQPLAAAQLAGDVQLGELVTHQPGPQLDQVGVALLLGAKHLQQVAGEGGGDAGLGGQLGGGNRPATVDLTSQPGVGDPLPRRPRVARPLRRRLAGRDASEVRVEGHRWPPFRSGHTTRAAASLCSRTRRRCIRVKARSVLRPRRRCARASRRAVRCSARSRRACSRGV